MAALVEVIGATTGGFEIVDRVELYVNWYVVRKDLALHNVLLQAYVQEEHEKALELIAILLTLNASADSWKTSANLRPGAPSIMSEGASWQAFDSTILSDLVVLSREIREVSKSLHGGAIIC